MSEKLKSCPFCGDTYIKTYRSRAGYQVGCNTVNCIACHAYARAYKTENEAIEAWNRRASAQPTVEKNEIKSCLNCEYTAALKLDIGETLYICTSDDALPYMLDQDYCKYFKPKE